MRAIVDRLARVIIPSQMRGALRHRLHPEDGRAWGGPFNGQGKRCLLFASLVGTLDPFAIVETGTYWERLQGPWMQKLRYCVLILRR
jgi:hypothetical protein